VRSHIQAVLATIMLIPLCAVFADDASIAVFTKTRMEYAKRKDFNPGWQHHRDRDKIRNLWNKGKTDEGTKLAKAWLEKHPVDAEMHLWYSFFLLKKGDYRGHFKHRHLYQGLLASITSSGTGLSVDSRMTVISVSEEYTVLKALGAKLIRQSLLSPKAGVRCDAMECNLNGKKITLYFDVSISMARTRQMLLTPRKDTKKKPAKKAGGSKKK